MGLAAPKSPNPEITDANDPRFTALSLYPYNWVRSGVIGDAMTWLGRGFEHYLFADNKPVTGIIAVGDIAMIGNRAGEVTAIAKTGNVIDTITVYEDLRYLPKDYYANPASYGYDNNAKKQGRTVVYVVNPDKAAAGIRNGGGKHVFLHTGSILILKKRTTDPETWTPEARAAVELQFKNQPKVYAWQFSTGTAVSPTTPTRDRLVFISKSTAAALVPGDKVYLNSARSLEHPAGSYYAGGAVYVKIGANGTVIP